MLLNDKISLIRKLNNLTQESFAEELCVSRQALSKWEKGTSVPDVQMLLRIADYYNLTLDQLVRDDFDLPMTGDADNVMEPKQTEESFEISDYLGKVCDISMNSFRCSVIRNAQIVGKYGDMICFVKNGRYGYFNQKKSLGILIKKEKEYVENNDFVLGKCTVYANKGTYYGGNTYVFSSIEKVTGAGVEVHTGKFVSNVYFEELSVVFMSDRIKAEHMNDQ